MHKMLKQAQAAIAQYKQKQAELQAECTKAQERIGELEASAERAVPGSAKLQGDIGNLEEGDHRKALEEKNAKMHKMLKQAQAAIAQYKQKQADLQAECAKAVERVRELEARGGQGEEAAPDTQGDEAGGEQAQDPLDVGFETRWADTEKAAGKMGRMLGGGSKVATEEGLSTVEDEAGAEETTGTTTTSTIQSLNDEVARLSEQCAVLRTELAAARSELQEREARCTAQIDELEVAAQQLDMATQSAAAWQQYGEGKDSELARASAKVDALAVQVTEAEAACETLVSERRSAEDEVARLLELATCEVCDIAKVAELEMEQIRILSAEVAGLKTQLEESEARCGAKSEELSLAVSRVTALEETQSAEEQGMSGALGELHAVKVQLEAATQSNDAKLLSALEKVAELEGAAGKLEGACAALSGERGAMEDEVASILVMAASEVTRVQGEVLGRMAEEAAKSAALEARQSAGAHELQAAKEQVVTFEAEVERLKTQLEESVAKFIAEHKEASHMAAQVSLLESAQSAGEQGKAGVMNELNSAKEQLVQTESEITKLAAELRESESRAQAQSDESKSKVAELETSCRTISQELQAATEKADGDVARLQEQLKESAQP